MGLPLIPLSYWLTLQIKPESNRSPNLTLTQGTYLNWGESKVNLSWGYQVIERV